MLKSIALRLMSSYLVIIVIISAVLSYVGIRVIGDRVVDEAQHRVAESLNAAREMYSNELRTVQQSVRVTGERLFLRDAIVTGRSGRIMALLGDVLQRERLDVLAVTDARGRVLWRPGNPAASGGQPRGRSAGARRPGAAPGGGRDDARPGRRSCDAKRPSLGDSARVRLVETPHARERVGTEETAGMMLMAAAPVDDAAGRLIGVAYGGVLLNRRLELVDRIKQVVFEDASYGGQHVGTATIVPGRRADRHQRPERGRHARHRHARRRGRLRPGGRGRASRWIGRAFVVNDWYITAYEPIRDRTRRHRRDAVRRHAGSAVRRGAATLHPACSSASRWAGAALAVAFSYFISQRLSVPLRTMVAASRRLADGDLDAQVEVPDGDEFAELAESFNAMAAALQARDEQLQEFARARSWSRSGWPSSASSAADVAHELNNPLQGIVTYSHLLLERGANGDAGRRLDREDRQPGGPLPPRSSAGCWTSRARRSRTSGR